MKLIEKMKAFTGGGVGFWGTILATVLGAALLAVLPSLDFWKSVGGGAVDLVVALGRRSLEILAMPAHVSVLGVLVLAVGWVLALVLLARKAWAIYQAKQLTELDLGFLSVLLIATGVERDVTDQVMAEMLQINRVHVQVIGRKLRSKKLVYFFSPMYGPDIHYKLDTRGSELVTSTGFDSNAIVEKVAKQYRQPSHA